MCYLPHKFPWNVVKMVKILQLMKTPCKKPHMLTWPGSKNTFFDWPLISLSSSVRPSIWQFRKSCVFTVFDLLDEFSHLYKSYSSTYTSKIYQYWVQVQVRTHLLSELCSTCFVSFVFLFSPFFSFLPGGFFNPFSS